MPEYRIYHLDRTGRVTTAEWLDAPGDEAAVKAALADTASVQCELWQGRRLVTRLPFGAQTAPQPTQPGDIRSAAPR